MVLTRDVLSIGPNEKARKTRADPLFVRETRSFLPLSHSLVPPPYNSRSPDDRISHSRAPDLPRSPSVRTRLSDRRRHDRVTLARTVVWDASTSVYRRQIYYYFKCNIYNIYVPLEYRFRIPIVFSQYIIYL